MHCLNALDYTIAMKVDKKIDELEKLAKQITDEKSFDKTMEIFTRSATLVKELAKETTEAKGKVTEIIKDVDGVFEEELQ